MKRLLSVCAVLVCAVALLLSAPSGAKAHSLFIQAGRYMVSQGKNSPFFFMYGHHFPVDDGIRRKKLDYVRILSPDGKTTDVALRDEKCLHSYMVDYDQPGTWALYAATTPGYFTTWIDEKDHTRHTMRPMSTVKDKAKSVKTALKSSQWAKTYVTCVEPSKDFPAMLGLPLELVPVQDPASLKQGDTLVLNVYADGKPYTEQGFWDATYMGFSTESEDMYVPRAEIQDGKIRLPLDVTGRWFVRFFVKLPVPEAEKGEYLQRKLTATLTFEIPNERKRPKIDGH